MAYHWELSSGTNFHLILTGANSKPLGELVSIYEHFFSIYEQWKSRSKLTENLKSYFFSFLLTQNAFVC